MCLRLSPEFSCVVTGERITALNYCLDLRPDNEYAPGTRGYVALEGFHGELSPSRCRFLATEHFESEASARARLEPQLEAWRQWVVLEWGSDWLPLRFLNADREAWPPPPPGSAVLMVALGEVCLASDAVVCKLTRGAFPELGPPFAVDDSTRVGLDLLRDSKQSPQHVLKYAYAFLSFLEAEHGATGRARRCSLARELNIDSGALNDLGRICASGGTGVEARAHKHGDSGGSRFALTPARRDWVFRILTELVRRQGQYAAGVVPAGVFDERLPE